MPYFDLHYSVYSNWSIIKLTVQEGKNSIMSETYVLSGRDPNGTMGIVKINSREIAYRVLESWVAEGFTEVDLAETPVKHERQHQHVSPSAR